MDHLNILKRALTITWRFRALWLFGFLLALCGGGGSGGGGNFGNVPGGGPGGGGDLGGGGISGGEVAVVVLVIAVLFLVIMGLAILATVVRVITRTALIGMVRQIEETEKVTIADGWRLGWSGGAWRLFLINLVIDIPIVILAIMLMLLAVSPLILLVADNEVLTVTGIVLAVLAVLFVLLILFLIGFVVAPWRELAWRRTVLNQRGVFASLGDAFGLIRDRFKDVAITYLLLIGLAIGWGMVALLVVLPVSIMVALVVGGIPALFVYLISQSGVGAAVAGILPAFLVLLLINSLATGFYLIYRSSIWTLAYLGIQEMETGDQEAEEPPAASSQSSPPAPEPEA